MEKRLYMLCLTLCLCFIGAGAFNLLRAQQSASRPIYRTESAVIGYRSVTGIYGLFIKKSQFFSNPPACMVGMPVSDIVRERHRMSYGSRERVRTGV